MHVRLFRQHGRIVIGVAASLSIVAVTAGVLSTSLSAQNASSGADLAKQYLAALTPAGQAISTAEAKLKKLPATASIAQVRAIVAPLAPALVKLEALNGAPPAPRGEAVGLGSLGRPHIVSPLGACTSYAAPASGARLLVGDVEYQTGVQLVTTQTKSICPQEVTWVDYSWSIMPKLQYFTAGVGYDRANSCPGTIIRFLGRGGRMLPFEHNGKLVEGAVIPSSGLEHVSINIAGQSVLTIQIDFTCQSLDYLTGRSVIDIVNGELKS